MTASSPESAPTALIAAYLDELFAMHPYVAIKAGLHAYDGRVADWSAGAIASRTDALQRYESALVPYATASLTLPRNAQGVPHLAGDDLARWDARLVLVNLRTERFFWETWRPHQHNPLIYIPLLDLSCYVKRPYAPLQERLAALVRHCAAIPDLLQVARQQVQPPIGRALLQQSIATFEGIAHFHAVDLLAVMQQVADSTLLGAFARANRAAVAAYRAFIGVLRGYLVHATPEMALGSAHLRGQLATAELVDRSLDELLAMGEEDLARNHARMAQVATRLGTTPERAMAALGRDHPPMEAILERTRALNEELRQFVIEHAVVTVPDASRCQVQETQPYMRNGSAYMDVPGPFESGPLDAYFYLTMPDPAWPSAQIEAWLAKQSIPGLANTAIHEAWPGHFLQFLHLRGAPTKASKLFPCTSFVEGWAHYAEEMLLEEGYHAEDPRYALQQVSMALLRDCRFLVALHLHTGNMVVDDAARFIAHEAYFTPIRAQQEAARGARAPGYMNYTLGKLLLMQLRTDLRQRYPGWSTRTLHDTLLAFGGPPIPLLREVLLGTAPMVPDAS